ncbi:fungal-specific transcription factor domain-containing protein [Aspergillus pseudoustus]|uniref:Fungal-specific transcription factor domain-containing protein n=1 Tax=Aspergillus pseudoustus TaxID=1810923 RepID=A0ABR4K5I0_9EURO
MSQRPRKLQRISKACDFCNRRSIKCNKNSGPLAPCQNCADFGVPCTYDRPIRRRGARRHASPPVAMPAAPPPAPLTGSSESGSDGVLCPPPTLMRDLTNGSARTVSISVPPDSSLVNPWKAFAVASQATILDLAQVYLEIVYPIFPLFHWPSFTTALENLDYLKNEGLFASTMAMCALASARARDGALYSNRGNSQQLANPPSEVFWSAAKESIPRDLAAAKGTEYMRTCAILSIASIQNGQIQDMQKYLGTYHTLAVMDGLHDEKLWPKDLDPIVVEIRRRLFWSIYTLDVYSSIVWGGIIRHREAQSNVRYPGDLRDEFISRNDMVSPASVDHNGVPTVNAVSNDWIVGWNFTTDMYRILEHALDSQRRRSPPNNGTAEVWSLFRPAETAGPWLMEHVLVMYSALPPQFRVTQPVIGDLAHDIFGFQSANIQATLQLLRMVLYSSEEQGVDGKCDVAGQVLSVFSNVPVEYLKAISSPLLHHLAGIGYILGSVMEGSLSEPSYQRVRTLLLEMADLLHRLESGLRQSTGTSERLRAQVSRIDEYMRTQRTANMARAPPRAPPILNPNNVNPAQPDLISPVYQQDSIAPIQTQAPLAGIDDSITYFQLPPELLDDWPWPFDAGVSEGMFPPAFIK